MREHDGEHQRARKRRGPPPVFIGPRGGRYIDPAPPVPAKDQNPHGRAIKRGAIVRDREGFPHEVQAVGVHHRTGRMAVLFLVSERAPDDHGAWRPAARGTRGKGRPAADP